MTRSAHPTTWTGAALAALALFAGARLTAEEPPPRWAGPSSVPTAAAALRDIMNHGADVYNRGDRNGCYRLFEGALLALRIHLADRPDLLRVIDRGLAEADRQESVGERAFTLRKALDDVRKGLKTRPALAGARPPDHAPAPRPAAPGSLWDRLGGEAGVRRVVDDLVDVAGRDPKVDFTRHGKYRLEGAALERFKKQMVDFFSQAAGGPYRYTGRTMREVHQGMGITDAQFDALGADLKHVLEKAGVHAADVHAVMRAVERTRPEIVEKHTMADTPPPGKSGTGKSANGGNPAG